MDGTEEVHEVKPAAEYARPDVRRRLELTAQAAGRHGHRYAATLASELHRRIDSPAIAAAWRRVGEPLTPALLHAVDDLLAAGPLPIGEACERVSGFGAGVHDFHRMLASGRVVADMTIRPDESMIVHGRGNSLRFGCLIPFTSPIGDRR